MKILVFLVILLSAASMVGAQPFLSDSNVSPMVVIGDSEKEVLHILSNPLLTPYQIIEKGFADREYVFVIGKFEYKIRVLAGVVISSVVTINF